VHLLREYRNQLLTEIKTFMNFKKTKSMTSAANHPVSGGTIQFWKVPKTGHFLKKFYEFDGV
jgi:hypothetical protein